MERFDYVQKTDFGRIMDALKIIKRRKPELEICHLLAHPLSPTDTDGALASFLERYIRESC